MVEGNGQAVWRLQGSRAIKKESWRNGENYKNKKKLALINKEPCENSDITT